MSQSSTTGALEGAGKQEGTEPFDIEALAKAGMQPPEHPPAGARYRIRIDKTHYVVETRMMTGTQLLALAGKTPQSHLLDAKLHGGQIKRIGPADVVDLAMKGLERFMTIPLTEQEGSSPARANRRAAA